MANRASAAFVVSIIGAAYQMIAIYVANLVDSNTSLLYYSYGYETLFFTTFLVFWGASHMLEDWKGRITWPSIVLLLGLANFSTIILAYHAQTSVTRTAANIPSAGSVIALITGPILIIIGGVIGFSAILQYSREHGIVVLSQVDR